MNRNPFSKWINSPLEVPIKGSVPYSICQDLLVPKCLGVYLIHDLRGVLYIGRSINLHRRFNEHLWYPSNPLLKSVIARPVGSLYFSWLLTSWQEMEEVEKELIRWFTPPCNRALYPN
jgi:predicted GIY-YIG superfamily endonuclease